MPHCRGILLHFGIVLFYMDISWGKTVHLLESSSGTEQHLVLMIPDSQSTKKMSTLVM